MRRDKNQTRYLKDKTASAMVGLDPRVGAIGAGGAGLGQNTNKQDPDFNPTRDDSVYSELAN